MLEVTTMLKTLTTISVLGLAATLFGCVAIMGVWIQGVSNTNLYTELPRTGTFAIQIISGDPIVGYKIERMLRYKLETLGYRFTETSPDLLASFS